MRPRSVTALLLAASCTSAPVAPEPTVGPRSPAATAVPSAPAEPFVRTCRTSVFGELDRGWRGDSILVGPLAFVSGRGYEHEPARSFVEPKGRWSGQKVLVVVTGETAVTVEIAPEARSSAGLAYDPATFNTHEPELTKAAVRFEPCPNQASTQFNGAFLVDGVSCVPVTVTVEGREPQARVFEFGPCAT